MKQLKVLTLLFLFLSLNVQLHSQNKRSERQLRTYYQQLKHSKVDSIIIVKAGCIGCEVTYTNTSKGVVDGQTIYVLTQKGGRFKLAIFDDINDPKYFSADTCLLFKIIYENKSVLNLKDIFYKEELAELKKAKFLPPRPIHYPYERLQISLPHFQYDFTVIGDDADYLGFVRENEKWFYSTKTIIGKFLYFIKTLKE